MTQTTEPAVTDAELDAACLRMLPAARAFVDAVRLRDDARTRAAFAEIQQVEVPLGRSPLAVLALVLADELCIRDAVVAGKATRAERERCVQLAVSVISDSSVRMLDNARRLPQRISRGEQP
jgi:hypothetical protein